MMRKFAWMCAMSLILAACGGDEAQPETNTESVTKPGGKADLVILDRICVAEGFGEGCDLCAELDWYGDDVCDDFCQNPDPDCGGDELQPGTCDWNASSPLGESSDDVTKLVVGGARFTIEDIDDLTTIQSYQVLEAVTLLGLVSEGSDFTTAFEAADEKTIEIFEVRADATDYQWVSFYAGDTETGVIFEANTTRRVAEISDGDLLPCAPGEPQPAIDPIPGDDDPEPAIDPQPAPDEVVCSYDEPWPVAQDSHELREKVTDSQEFTKDDLGNIEHNTSNQLYFSLVHLELLTGTEDFEAIFEAVDDGLFKVLTVKEGEDTFQWVSFYAGDTQAGAVFEADTLTIVAEIQDGGILSCK